MNYIQYLLNIPTQKIKYGLSRTHKLLTVCGNPEKSVQTIQVVGTNGKGSVSALISNILMQSNNSIGLYTSPHLVSINERIRINFQSIQNSYIELFFKNYFEEIKKIKPSFFEIMTALALWYFKKKNVDYAVLETGLGGRLDSVTACNNDYIVFTPISIDHSEILGSNITKIAKEKFGSINKNTKQCISIIHSQLVNNILNAQAKKFNIKVNYLSTKTENNIRIKYLRGIHQYNNALLAKHAISVFEKHEKIDLKEKNILYGIKTTFWPGRFQTINKKPKIIFDVCHNDQGIQTFKNTVKENYKEQQNKYLICGFEYNKKIEKAINSTAKLFTEIVCTEAGVRKSMSAKTIQKILEDKNNTTKKSINDSLDYLYEKINHDDVIFIIGSHFFAPALSKRYKNCFAIDK